MRGVDKIDSFNANLAKVGLGGFDSSPMWVRSRFDLINSFIETPDYLKNHENEFPEQGEHNLCSIRMKSFFLIRTILFGPYTISRFLFRLSNKPSKLDNSIWKKISSNPYLVYDEMVWQRRNGCEFETTSW